MTRLFFALRRRLQIAAIFGMALMLPGCDQGPFPEYVGLAFVKGSGERTPIFRVEVANTTESRSQASDSRLITNSDRGVLLVYPSPNEYLVSNRNGPQAVDIIFIGPTSRLVGVLHSISANDNAPRTIGAASLSILFLEGGMARRIGISQGDMLLINGAMTKPS